MSQFYSILPSYKKLSVIDHTAAICINTFHNLLVQITRSTSSPKALQAHVNCREGSQQTAAFEHELPCMWTWINMTCRSPGMLSLRPPFSRPEEMHHRNTCRKIQSTVFSSFGQVVSILIEGATVFSWPAFNSAAVSRPSPFLQASHDGHSFGSWIWSTFMRETHQEDWNAWKMLGHADKFLI